MRRDRRAGVALLEMMIALALMTMIAVMAASSFGFYGRTLSRVDAGDDTTEQAIARRTLRLFIESLPLSTAGVAAADRFDGRPDRLRFATLMRDGAFWPGDFVHVVIAVEGAGAEAALVVRAKGTAAARDEPLTETVVLARGVSRLRIGYWGRVSLGDQPRWFDGWSGVEALPELVKIEAVGPDGPIAPLVLQPALIERQAEMSLSSLLPPGRPSRP